MELVEHTRHARPAYAEYDSKKIMRQRQVLVSESVASHKQPAGKARFDVTHGVGTCGVGDLDPKAMRITKQARTQCAALRHLTLEMLDANTPCAPLHQHDSFVGRARAAKEDG